MAKRSDDYIPTYSDYIHKQDEMKEYQRTHKDPREKYKIKYTIYGKEYSEDVFALNQAEAIAQLKQSWSMNGIYIDVVGVVQLEQTKENVDDRAGVQN